jgi:DNA repair protein RadD
MPLRPDQEEVNTQIRAAMSQGKRQVFVQCCTGWGKSFLARHQIHAAASRGKLVYYIVPRIMLQEQMADTIGLPHAINCYKEGVNVCVFTMQTLVKIKEQIPLPALIYIDEAHFGGATLDEISLFYKERNVYSVYLSATPEDTSGRGFTHWTDTLIQGKPMRWLIDNGMLSDYELYAPDYAMDSATIYGDIAHEWRTHASGLRTLGFCIDRTHAKQVQAGLLAQGLRVGYIDGTMRKQEIRRIVMLLVNRDIDILLSVALVTTGFDLEQYVKLKVVLEAMLDLAKCNKLPLQLQKWGRFMRAKPQPAVILDMVGNCHIHGKPCQERAWTLEGKEARQRAESGEPSFNLKICEHCYEQYSTTRNICPHCGCVASGNERKIEVLKGELKRVEVLERKHDLITLRKLEGNKGVVRWYTQQGSSKPAMAAMMRITKGKYDKKLLKELMMYEQQM